MLTLDKIKYNNTVSYNTLLDLIYPVNSIYLSIDSTSPATKFGGT